MTYPPRTNLAAENLPPRLRPLRPFDTTSPVKKKRKEKYAGPNTVTRGFLNSLGPLRRVCPSFALLVLCRALPLGLWGCGAGAWDPLFHEPPLPSSSRAH